MGSLWRSTLTPLIVLFALVASHACALPFLGPEKDFELRLPDHPQLKESLSAELMQQKENNALLKQFSSQYKIDQYQADTIRRMLRAEGYYDSEVTHQRLNDTTLYTIKPGPRYTVSELHIDFPVGRPKPDADLLQLQEGDPLRAEEVLASRGRITDWIYLNLCLYQVDVSYEATVFHQNHTASVTYTLQPSENVKFGELTLTGHDKVEADYLRARIPIEKGDCFTRQRVDQTRLTLLQTNLIASVEADVGQPRHGRVPVTFRVTERPPRTIRAGITYGLDLGPGFILGWEHRNLFGRAENLEISARVNEVRRSLESEFTIPHFRRPHQSLVLHANALKEKPDAYEVTSGSIGAALARQIAPDLFGSLGVKLSYSQVLEDNIENDYRLVSVPFTLDYDKRDNLLNPTSGWRVAVALEPFVGLDQSERRFFKRQVTAQALYTVTGWLGQPTFATRIALGSLAGIERRQVPADLRFYVGGGGSVRGYPYQSLGELTNGEPDGGLSFTEIAFETRVRFSESWGGVVFLDGGYAYPEELPELGENLFWGAGVGVRYLTDFAPIRFDVAFPLDRREGIDDAFQLYISIGQAF